MCNTKERPIFMEVARSVLTLLLLLACSHLDLKTEVCLFSLLFLVNITWSKAELVK